MTNRLSLIAAISCLSATANARREELPLCSNNLNDPNKLDVVFVPLGFDSVRDFKKIAKRHIDRRGRHRGILYFDPFKSARRKFRFWRASRLNQEVEDYFIGQKCLYGDSSQYARFVCITQIMSQLAAQGCKYDKAIIIFDNRIRERGGWGGWANKVGGFIAVTVAKESPGHRSLGHIRTVHEFAHLLGLADENVRRETRFGKAEDLPNCDVAGCKKWCIDYQRNPSGTFYEICKNLPQNLCQNYSSCFWREVADPYYHSQCVPLNDDQNIGIDCLPGTGCYHNCAGIGAWRPANFSRFGKPASSLMFDLSAIGFDAVDKRFLEQVLRQYK